MTTGLGITIGIIIFIGGIVYLLVKAWNILTNGFRGWGND